MADIKQIADLKPHYVALCELLVDTVDGGASIGFHPPLAPPTAQAYWTNVQVDIAAGTKRFLGAFLNERLVGCVQLSLNQKDNGQHRAEVEKLMVRPSARGCGIARELMTELENVARGANRSLLILDTRTGDVAAGLYRKLGYVIAGEIPDFTLEVDGSHCATTIFFKALSS